MSAELHQKIVAFLAGEFARKDGRQCTKVELVYAQAGFRDEELRSWVREEQPELFENFTKIDDLATMVIEITEGHADAFGMGQHRYMVRTHQHLGGRATCSFRLSPAYGTGLGDDGGAPGGAMTRSGGSEAAMGVVTQNNLALMRTNQAMFQASFGTLASLSEGMRQENATLRNENATLKRKLEEAESTKLFKEFEVAQQAEKNQLKAQGLKQLMQFGTIAMAKFTGGNLPGANAQTPLGMMVYKFGESLRPDQIQSLFTMLDIGQKALFAEIMQHVAPPEDPAQQQGQQGHANGANGTNGAPHP